MKKYIFEYAKVVEAENEEEAMNIFEQDIVDQISDGDPKESIVDWFTIRKVQ